MNDQKEDTPIRVKINHPKLAQTVFCFSPNTPLLEVTAALAQNNILQLFNNYHFEQNGIPLKNTPLFAESLKEVKDTLELQVVFQPFKYSTAMYHFQQVAKLLKQPQNLYSLLRPNTKQQRTSSQMDVEALMAELVPQSFRGGRWTIEEVISPSYCSQLWADNRQSKSELVQFILMSGFNPPPSQAQFAGDLFYIHLKTLQNYDCHITASPLGFYQNQSKINSYNPSSLHSRSYPNLLDLLATLSDRFAQTMESNLSIPEKKVMQKICRKNEGLLKNVNTRVTGWKWMNCWEQEHQWNTRKTQSLVDLEYSNQTLGDWNQQFLILQKQRQDLQQTPNEKQKAQAYRQIYSPFAEAAVSGARKIVQGKLLAINHMDEKKKHIFIQNNIFFSVTQDTPYDHRLEKGEDAIPSASSANVDLNNLQSLIHLPPTALRLLHTVLVNYQGFKIIGQTIIPGLLSSELSYLTQYGSIDEGKSIQVNPQFHQLMLPVCKQLHLDDHVQAEEKSGKVVVIAVSPQIKGIRSIGGEYYLCDLQKLSPRDLNYEGAENQACILRQTLIQKFIDDKRINFGEHPAINVNVGTQVKFKTSSKTQQQEQMLNAMARYIKETAVPNLIQALKSKNAGDYLTDSQGLSSIFHEYGVNMRYLGFVERHDLLKDSLEVRFCLIRVILVRSLKHLFKMALRQTSCIHLSLVSSHLLNCIFAKKHMLFQMNQSEDNEDKPQVVETKKKKKKKNKQDEKEPKHASNEEAKIIKIDKSPYLSLKPSEVWEEVKKISTARFHHQFDNTIFQFIEKGLFSLPYQKFATLRDLCLNVGLVLEKKDYALRDTDKDNDLPFSPKNILSFIPIPKLTSIHISSTLKLKKEEADQLFSNGNYGEALKAYDEVVARMRERQEGEKLLSYCLGQISRIYYMMGNIREAITVESQNLAYSRRAAREDSLEVMRCYSRLGLYCMGLSSWKLALWLLYKSLYLMLICFGEVYPDVLINFANIARVHQLNKEVSMASSCYLKAIELLTQIYGGKCHVNISFCYSSLASLHYEQGQYRKSVDYQNEAVSIIQKVLSPEDSRLLDAFKILKVYKEILGSSKGNAKGSQHATRFKK